MIYAVQTVTPSLPVWLSCRLMTFLPICPAVCLSRSLRDIVAWRSPVKVNSSSQAQKPRQANTNKTQANYIREKEAPQSHSVIGLSIPLQRSRAGITWELRWITAEVLQTVGLSTTGSNQTTSSQVFIRSEMRPGKSKIIITKIAAAIGRLSLRDGSSQLNKT